jgi:hypothetical protein
MVTREEVKWRRPSSVRLHAEDKAFLYFKSFQILNLDLNFFPWSKNIQTLQSARLEHTKQLCALTQLQIPSSFHVVHCGTNSNLNFP